jgi:RNA polymerase sigma-70 factor (ECF subfamily)
MTGVLGGKTGWWEDGTLALRQEELTSLCDDVDLERDRALVERCQAGDSAAFGNLYARYYERLLRFCLRRLHDRHEAEDAAQEAFARAWKALPKFAGERRFYPWLTVIAGNICTDVLRRRSRSTPTDDMELIAQQPVGGAGADTSEELVLAAVDGELVNRALDRLSKRHRHVLAMREGSGWTYQQIADHEGVDIGTIETLLWRARQALKREFAVVSESKEALAGFLVAGAALFRRTIFRLAHRGASVQSRGGNSGGLRSAVAGVALGGAAVAAALVTPHALSNGPSNPAIPLAVSSGAAAANPALPSTAPSAKAGATGNSTAGSVSSPDTGGTSRAGSPSDAGSGGGTSGTSKSSLLGGSGAGGAGVLSGATGGPPSELNNTVKGATSGLGGAVSGVTNGLGGAVGGVTNGLGGAVSGVTNGLGGATSNLSPTVNGAVNGLNGTVSGILGGVPATTGGTTDAPTSGGSGSGGSSSGSTTQTTTTTTPNLVGGLTNGVGGTLNGLLGG